MTNLVWIIPIVILAAIFAVVGLRDIVGFLRVGPGVHKRYRAGLVLIVWLAGILGILYWHGWYLRAEINAFFWAEVLGFSLVLMVLISWRSSLRDRGPGRMWAMAWTTFREAMSQRAWLAVPLWLVGVLVVGIFVSPYRLVQDRMMLSTQLLIGGQLLVVGVLILALACRSIPQELERKTILVTASKPISLLELVWGKLLGFLLLGGMLVAVMGVLSYAVLWYNGQQVRRQARLELITQQEQYERLERELPPDSDLQEIVDAGVLYARDAVYPEGPPSFNGKFDEQLDRWFCLKGGSSANIQWRFNGIEVTAMRVPRLALGFGVERVPGEMRTKRDSEEARGLRIKIAGIGTRNPRQSGVNEYWELPVPPDDRLFFDTGNRFVLGPEKWGALYNVGSVVITLSLLEPGHYLYFGQGSAKLVDLSPEGFELSGAGTEQWPTAEGRGVVVARKFRNAYEIAGVEEGEPEVAYWKFKNVDLSKFGPGEDVRFEIQSYREKSDAVKSYTVGLVRAMTIKPDGTKEFWPTGKELETLAEEKLLERPWVGWKQIVIQEKRPSGVNLPRRLFSKDADVYVFLACGSEKEWLALGAKSGYLARGRGSFIANVARCEAIVFLQVSAIAAVGVMASSFLSWPVACFLSMIIYLLGAARPYMQEMAGFWGETAEDLSTYAMGGLGMILPNFAIYRASEFISEGEIISGEKLAFLFDITSLSVLCLAVLAYLFLRGRELAK